MKKLLSIFIAIILLSTSFIVAFADEEADVVKHEISFEVPANSSIGGDDLDIWGTGSFISYSGNITYTPLFTIPDRYFAFEMRATGCSTSMFTVALVDDLNSFYASGSTYADGIKIKVDWIEVTAGDDYRFRIVNNTGSTLTVYITYYSWA